MGGGRSRRPRVVALGAIIAWAVVAAWAPGYALAKIDTRMATEGTLFIATSKTGKPRVLPLAKTDVRAEVLGFVSRVAVQQTFNNPYKTPLEVVYVFPLPNKAAVGAMTMRIGTRVIKAQIKTREQARKIYDDAKRAGKRTALLEQERPNIFTQSVANVAPGEDIHIEIVYDVVLEYDKGVYEFVYPMVVGPRYIPGTPLPPPSKGGGTSPDTTKVPDASRITPPLRKPGTRSGHEVTMSVVFDPGMKMQTLTSPTHRIVTQKVSGTHGVRVSLAPGDRIPNRDFVVRYTLARGKPSVSAFAATGPQGGHFALLFEPPAKTTAASTTKKELFFVIDTSGSMRGEPLSLVKRAMRYALGRLAPGDTFQIIRFASAASTLSKTPLPATPANIRRGMSYINGLAGDGGTEMLRGLRAALASPPSPGRIRIVCFMTDGFIGNESDVLSEVGKRLRSDTRLFAFGVGSSVNRFLLDRMARLGRGDVHYALHAEPAAKQVKSFYERIRAPVLTDIKIEWGGLAVADVAPRAIPDVFAGRPVQLVGRYQRGGSGTVVVHGKIAGRKVSYRVPLVLPSEQVGDGTLGRLWARGEIRRLMTGQHRGGSAARAAVTKLALAYGLVSRFTSFVAVERKVKVEGGQRRVYHVPVEVPRGVSYRGVVGDAAGGDADEDIDLAPKRAAPVSQGAAESIVLTRQRVTRPGQWRLHAGLGLGLGVGHGPDGVSAALARVSLRVDRALSRHHALGLEGLAMLPELGLDDAWTNLALTLSRTLLLRGFLDLTFGVGGGFNGGDTGLFLSGNAQVFIPYARRFATSLTLRVDSVLVPRSDRAGVTSSTFGVQLSW